MEHYDDVYSLWEQCEGIGLSDFNSPENTNVFLLRNPGLSFIAREKGELVGAVFSGHDGRRGYAYHLALRKNHGNQSLGRQLIEKCISALKLAGIKSVIFLSLIIMMMVLTFGMLLDGNLAQTSVLYRKILPESCMKINENLI